MIETLNIHLVLIQFDDNFFKSNIGLNFQNEIYGTEIKTMERYMLRKLKWTPRSNKHSECIASKTKSPTDCIIQSKIVQT
jgi:hypothetical protein